MTLCRCLTCRVTLNTDDPAYADHLFHELESVSPTPTTTGVPSSLSRDEQLIQIRGELQRMSNSMIDPGVGKLCTTLMSLVDIVREQR